ncbi:hypothetical protein HETIRDRAFT_114020 [Heterobasidion irregulare TC 32-1]|uniref:Uncharacterized protein n=1 Tax=Heterobasidion irregulare (strain TC 32-1) TaxID=747525 RepID=W4KN54_HETIT|nr:uncharacterized protein HETIRDRAFT_114020 [Heterobasidion irregulare TC 32-1]ETW86481.1 hypothetical protein HETIRDRAFT_114020 [Heterobasidion irregulare TC 32-1]
MLSTKATGTPPVARKWGVTVLTPGAVVFASIMALFLLSTDSHFNKNGQRAKIDYETKFNHYKGILLQGATNPTIKATLAHLNQRVLSTTVQANSTSAISVDRGQQVGSSISVLLMKMRLADNNFTAYGESIGGETGDNGEVGIEDEDQDSEIGDEDNNDKGAEEAEDDLYGADNSRFDDRDSEKDKDSGLPAVAHPTIAHLLASAWHAAVLPTTGTPNLTTLVAAPMAAAVRHPVQSAAPPPINVLPPPMITLLDASRHQSSTGQAVAVLPVPTLQPVDVTNGYARTKYQWNRNARYSREKGPTSPYQEGGKKPSVPETSSHDAIALEYGRHDTPPRYQPCGDCVLEPSPSSHHGSGYRPNGFEPSSAPAVLRRTGRQRLILQAPRGRRTMGWVSDSLESYSTKGRGGRVRVEGRIKPSRAGMTW